MKSFIKYAAAAVLTLVAVPAMAQYNDGTENNTDAGETVTNEATVTYSVGGVTQEAEADDVEFVVDRVILVTVTSNGGTSVAPGADDQALSFDVTNDSNATLDFILAAANAGGNDFDATGLTYWLEDGTTAGFQDDEDTQLSVTGDGILLADMDEGETAEVYVVGDIPTATEATAATQTVGDGDTADITLLATAYENDGLGTDIIEETNVAVANEVTPMFEDTVFGDGDGDVDADQDGAHSDTGTFTIATATISVTKSSVVISDPFNGTTNPKAIPGAVIEYCILIENGGGTAATDVAVSDPIPDFTTYDPGTIEVADDCAGTNATAEDDDSAGGDESDGASGNYDATPGSETVNTEVDNLAGGSDTATIFRVIVD